MNISRLTSKYIREHPSIADCLNKGLINFSALARAICFEHNLEAFDAVLVACRRHFSRSQERRSQEERIRRLVKNAKIRIRTKILVAIVEKGRAFERLLDLQILVKKEGGDFHLIEGEKVITIITNVEFSALVKRTFGAAVKRITENIILISMIFDETIEIVPGVVSYLYNLLAGNGINIREEMSCWTDLMIVIDERDMSKAVQVLSG